MPEDTNTVPTSIRRLDNDSAARLARLVEAYDDLQTVLRCCERLMAMLADSGNDPDEVGVEALWTLALLSYVRAFAEKDGVAALTESNLPDGKEHAEALRFHRVLLRLRDHHANPASNPRETYTVGVAQDSSGAVNAVAVTSVRTPLVEESVVRQVGALAFPLCAALDEQIDPLQKALLAEVRDTPTTQLEEMDLIEVAVAG